MNDEDIELHEDEQAWIRRAPERCEGCGHLFIFHNSHCCSFCLVDECGCRG